MLAVLPASSINNSTAHSMTEWMKFTIVYFISVFVVCWLLCSLVTCVVVLKQLIKNRRFPRLVIWFFNFFFWWRIGVFIHQNQVFDFLTIAVMSAKNRPDNCRGSEPVSTINCPTTLVWNLDNFFTGKISPKKNEIKKKMKMKWFCEGFPSPEMREKKYNFFPDFYIWFLVCNHE
jgi:hypothetical protein